MSDPYWPDAEIILLLNSLNVSSISFILRSSEPCNGLVWGVTYPSPLQGPEPVPAASRREARYTPEMAENELYHKCHKI